VKRHLVGGDGFVPLDAEVIERIRELAIAVGASAAVPPPPTGSQLVPAGTSSEKAADSTSAIGSRIKVSPPPAGGGTITGGMLMQHKVSEDADFRRDACLRRNLRSIPDWRD
jgi:hypothetical protein